MAQFGGVNLQPNIVRGIWIWEGVRYEDELIRLVIDVEDTPENHSFFEIYKTIFLERFNQVERVRSFACANHAAM